MQLKYFFGAHEVFEIGDLDKIILKICWVSNMLSRFLLSEF